MKRVMESKYRFALLIFLMSSFLTKNVVGQDVSPLVPEIKKALRLADIEQTNKAVESLNTLVQSNPTDASLLYYLGYAQIKKGSLDEALATFEKGIKLNDKEALNYAGKGHVRVLQNNPVESKTFFDKALSMTKSKVPAVLNAVGEGYLSSKQYTNEALQVLSKSKSSNSKDPATFILLGDAYLQQNNGGLAVTNYENAANLDPKNGKPHYKTGVVYWRSKNVPLAVEAYNKAITADPEYAPAYKELGEIYYVDKKGEEAVKVQEKYLSLTENPEPGKRQLAFYYFMAKNYTKANEMFKEIVQTPDVTPITWRFFAVSSMETEEFDQSRMAFDKYFSSVKPEEIQASDYASLGQALLKMKEDSLAIEAFDKSIALDSTRTDILQLQSETLMRKKKYDRAIPVIKQLMLLRQKPLSMDYYAIGRAYYYNQQFAEADSAFTKLIELQPTMTVGYLWQARIKASQDPESTQGLAKPYFDKLVEVASTNPEKNKADLVEAYRYLGYYAYLQKDNATSKSYWQKVLALVPKDPQATEAIEILNKLMSAPKPKN
jgi:tetratricopeptide (TPR) repeat protein